MGFRVGMGEFSVVVDEPDLGGATIGPAEDDSPLVVDANRMVTPQIATERFKAVTRWHAKVLKPTRRVEHEQLPECRPLEIDREALDDLASKQRSGPAIGE